MKMTLGRLLVVVLVLVALLQLSPVEAGRKHKHRRKRATPVIPVVPVVPIAPAPPPSYISQPQQPQQPIVKRQQVPVIQPIIKPPEVTQPFIIENVKAHITQRVNQPMVQPYIQQPQPIVQPIMQRTITPVVHNQVQPVISSTNEVQRLPTQMLPAQYMKGPDNYPIAGVDTQVPMQLVQQQEEKTAHVPVGVPSLSQSYFAAPAVAVQQQPAAFATKSR